MPRVPLPLGLLGLLLAALLLLPPPAWALARTFVSGSGNNTNPCTREAPCRSLQRGVNRVDAGGEVVILDSAGYSPFTVAKAVTVVAAPGVHAGITVPVGLAILAITVTAGPTDVVVLRGLTLISLGGGSDGIHFLTGQALHVENVVISGFRVGMTSNPGQLFLKDLKDTIVRDNVVRGIDVLGSVSIEDSRFEGNGDCGVHALQGAKVSVRGSVASGNGNGFCALPFSSAPAEINVHDSLVTNNSSNGIICATGAGATARVSNSIVTGNGAGLRQGDGCTFESLGNNTVRGNGTDISGTITVIAEK